jgi:hypothetical protein
MALDNEYRDRWEEYHLVDGTFRDSRKTYWRDVEWEKVVRLVAHLRGNVFEVTAEGKPGFITMIRFRSIARVGGQDHFAKYSGHAKTETWELGWTDGQKCYLKAIDFKRGALIREHTEPLKNHMAHIHPRVKRMLFNEPVRILEPGGRRANV